MAADVRIGTSGWHYKHWVGPFYPSKLPSAKMLGFYQERFDTVEVNNSFYRLPPESALAIWRDSTPPGFCFAIKGSRFLTHMKKLKNAEVGLERFLARAVLLGSKLGPVLFQLPPSWEVDASRLESFLSLLPVNQRFAFEFRNQTWNVPIVFELLRRFNAAYCAFDLAGYQSPVEVTADFAYVRLHGPGGKYQGSYSDSVLERWAERVSEWRERLRAVYVYFDNDEAGYAAVDALRLRQLISARVD